MLGHAGFMSVGAFSGIIAAMSLQSAIPSEPIRLAIAMVVGALVAALAGVIVGTPVLRLRGDYLAIVTLAFGEIIKDLITCLLVGHDSRRTFLSRRTGLPSSRVLRVPPAPIPLQPSPQAFCW